jgi:hypothetical protein
MKLCIDCKHHMMTSMGTKHACHHPESDAFNPSPVNGELTDSGSKWSSFCESNRGRFGACGPSGDFFEQKPPTLWQRFIKHVNSLTTSMRDG